MKRRYLGTISAEDVGKHRYMALPGTIGRLLEAMGQILPGDVGKQYFDVGGVVQVENDEQRDRRIAETARASAMNMSPDPAADAAAVAAVLDAIDNPARAIEAIARAGARVHQLRFARERLEKVKAEMAEHMDGYSYQTFTAWLEAVDYAIAQIRAAEGPQG
jgi:hypothetical protein